MDEKYRLFRPGQTVVDLGYAPGSWSQVAMERTRPHGRVVGIDLIPAQPPRGVATFQGDFLSPQVQALVRDFILRTHKPRPPGPSSPLKQRRQAAAAMDEKPSSSSSDTADGPSDTAPGADVLAQPSYIDQERHMGGEGLGAEDDPGATSSRSSGMAIVDVVLSDMSEPWPQTNGYTTNTLSNPYHRLMNTSGNTFRDHAGSMDLCNAALQFASDTLRPGGHFVCKFYQGAEDKKLEKRLKGLFAKVHREKPESSRSESKESYFIALRRKHGVVVEEED
ncbi:Methylene-fatty-acyl-phospholipid synthase [Purpureocillium takamizusanense]|nr:Methylene-fatty-acyl-phospholipid synthase [Purpureocillium takamizusanense]UNI15613.1 Methylene-fatty-acyl-phospholipid synthase [Purpureocillium takamizusanense]